MTKSTHQKPRRSVIARRTITLGTTIATAALGAGVMAAPVNPGLGHLDKNLFEIAQNGASGITLVAGSEGGEGGEGGEGEGSTPLDPGVALLRDLGIIQAHLTAGFALYEAGDIAAARTHMGAPVSLTNDAISELLAAHGQGQLRDQLVQLAQSAEAEIPADQLLPLLSAAQTTINDARSDLTISQQVTALSLLTRVAAEEYSSAVAGETISNLHGYQTSWGILQGVKAQAETMSESKDEAVSSAAAKVLNYLTATDPAFGDLRAAGVTDMRASLIFGAAARIELATIGLQ